MRIKPVTCTRTGGVREAGLAHELGCGGGVSHSPTQTKVDSTEKYLCGALSDFSEKLLGLYRKPSRRT